MWADSRISQSPCAFSRGGSGTIGPARYEVLPSVSYYVQHCHLWSLLSHRAMSCRYYLDTAKFTISGGDGLSDDEARVLYIYSCEWEPRQQSLYYRLNAALRDKDRSKVRPFVSIIKLLCTAMGKVTSVLINLHYDLEPLKAVSSIS